MSTAELRVGDYVHFSYGAETMNGRIVEDRGPIGMKGRRLYLVSFWPQHRVESRVELPADELAFAEPPPDVSKEERARRRRRQNQVNYIYAVDAVEAYSVFAQPEHADSLIEFLKECGARYRREKDVVDGEDNLLIEKDLPFDDFVALLNEWKKEYAEGTDKQ